MGIQMTSIDVDQRTAVILRAKAEAQGVTIADWLRSLAETEMPIQQPSFFETASPEERAKAVEQWVNRQTATAPPLSDDAISRDGIYGEREDKQV